ncbi:hypothetical protein PGLA_20690 [Paenibacillus glacialis]|uniref:Uncharacterized protein n=2 Tax=Paenibacillus glacialis TaxID=494026 RepID=A0A168H3T9_9BACL|nr:hypothetical protein PGLA_20690 [Paenibacillus glacialis]
MKEGKEEYTRNYNLQSSLMTKASQGKTQSEQPLEVNAKSIESKSTSSILNLDPVMAQLQSLFEKSGLDLLAISQKPEYLNKTEDTSKLYSRFTFYQKVVAPQILGAELNILLGVVAIVSAVFTGGGSLLLYTLVAGELILGGAEIKINAEKLGDLYDGEYYTNPKFLGMDQDVVNALGLVLGGAELSLGLKALLKSGDYAANARYIDDLEDIMDDVRLGPNGTGKIDDFAKEPFLPDEYYQKIDNYLAKAIAARDAEVARIQALSKTQQSKFTTVVAGVDLRTGEVIVGSKNSAIFKGHAICAEDLVISQLIPLTNANIIMTSAIRPRTGAVIAVCTRCQIKFPVNQFIKGTVFD